MNLTELLALIQRRVTFLTQSQAVALSVGDIAESERIAAEIAEAQAIIQKLLA